ncbi:hypothetical protein [Allorhizocola rhizosphaerae]|uniref:hypothetical protein n=1 Tax=Allorhizocola rhizosphaerae TaxID=1872709 RepID=UPI000E3E75C7|nr:hypothetical protein [Allorhizocola rhizosphaerae]
MVVDIVNGPARLPAGDEWSLLRLPYVFSQDGLLSTEDFIKQAKERGITVSLEQLAQLHEVGLLNPLYLVVDEIDEARRIDGAGLYAAATNPRGRTFAAAREGRLRIPAEDGYDDRWPFKRPADLDLEEGHFWWNGYIYSPWQLLDLAHELNEYEFIKAGWAKAPHPERQQRRRQLTCVLAALATRYLPGILGQMNLPDLDEREELHRYRASIDVQQLVQAAGFDATLLAGEADTLLLHAHNEPLAKWLPLIRHAGYRGWSQLGGEPLHAIWQRIAAEILLRAHEDLVATGVLEPLPDLTGSNWHSAQHDRLTPRYAEAQTLDRALAELGLSPHPKVILLVEGETELEHVPKLLAEFGLGKPQDVRVQRTKGSKKINAHLIARYGVTPRVGRPLGVKQGWFLDASLTSLVIAMDPEHEFTTQESRDEVRRKLQVAIREEVEYQDATISQEELNALVQVRVWGDHSYELANFTDDELVPALTLLAHQRHNRAVEEPDWELRVRAELQAAREAHQDIKVAMGKIRLGDDKTGLAQILWPVLRAKCELELAVGTRATPVLDLILEVQRLVAKLSGVFALAGEP